MAETRRAVVIGINDYGDPKINLSGAVNDAREIYHILKDNGEFTIDEEKHFLTDQQATCVNIRAAISDLFWKTDEKCDVALFYFAGHGRRDHLDYGYLLPQDADYTAPFVKGIKIQDLKDLFLRSKLRTTGIMILDCCYSGIATQTRGGPEALSGDPIAKKDLESFHEELRLPAAAQGRFILASADANKTAREVVRKHAFGEEEHPHGLYSFHLIEGLMGAPKNEYGRVSLGALVKHLEDAFRGDLEHQPQHNCAGSGEHSIILTTIGAELEERLGKCYAEVREFLGDKTAMGVLTAIEILNELMKQGLQRAEIDQCFLEAQKTLDQLLSGEQAYQWWAEKQFDILRGIRANKIESRRWFDVLGEVMVAFEIDTIRNLDKKGRALLRQVIDIVKENESHQNVVRYISMLERDRIRVGSETIGIQNARHRYGSGREPLR